MQALQANQMVAYRVREHNKKRHARKKNYEKTYCCIIDGVPSAIGTPVPRTVVTDARKWSIDKFSR